MSPRKTRRAAKSEGIDDTLSETISKKALADTPAEKQQKVRIRRQLTKASSVESDVDQSLEMNKSKRTTVQETPSKAPRSRKKVLLDNTAIDETSTVTNTRTRRTGRGKEALMDQTVLQDSTTLDESSSKVNKSRGTRARKKNAKKANSKSSDEETVPNKRMNASAAKNVTLIEDFIDLTSNDDAVPMSDEDTEVLQVSTRISRLRATAAATASLLPGNRRSRKAKVRLEDFTPESSPITVNLTPHRTTKTPRKSPMNLGSPKSHADALLKLSKTPRKLPVVVESPTPSEISVSSSSHSTPEKSNLLVTETSKKLQKSPESRKSPGKSRRDSPNNVIAVRKFAKSPKIVLRSPKAKSTKSKAPRVSVSKVKRPSIPKRSTKSPPEPSKSPVASPSLKSPDSPRKSNALPSPKKDSEPTSRRRTGENSGNSLSSPSSQMTLQLARIDSPNAPRESKLYSPTSNSRVSNIQSPTVILNKISPSTAEAPETVTRSSVRRTILDDTSKSTPAKSPSAEKRMSQGGESPHRAKSTRKKGAAITDSGTPLRPIDSPRSSTAAKLAAAKSIILSSSNTLVENASPKTGSGRMLSSTPRERIRRSLNLSPGLVIPSEVVNSPVNGELPAGSSTMISERRPKRRSLRIDDKSNSLISEDESLSTSPRGGASRLDETYEVSENKDATITVENEQEKTGNGTYELAEPKTPNLRKKAGKRSLGDIDTSVEERTVKRTCRVRFASPALNGDENKTIGAVIGRSRSATPRHRVELKCPSQTHNGSTILLEASKSKDSENKSHRRSSSMTNASLLKTPVAGKRRSNSASDANARSATMKAQISSVNRLSKPRLLITSTKKPEIPEVKTPVARKAPNFAQIHQKKFARMESLVDAKKRVEKRHLAMSHIPTSLSRVNSKVPTKLPVSSQPIAPVVAVNGGYNRYGFKLRKDDALKIVTQKQPSHTSQKKQHENRLLLKGVRTNRRFDLIMKARNINI